MADVPELDYRRLDSKPQEINLICLIDDRLVVGEAKIKAELGSGSKRRASIIKLVRVANLLAADEIALCTTAPAPWKQEDIDLLRAEVTASRWHTGVVPAVRILADLRAGALTRDRIIGAEQAEQGQTGRVHRCSYCRRKGTTSAPAL